MKRRLDLWGSFEENRWRADIWIVRMPFLGKAQREPSSRQREPQLPNPCGARKCGKYQTGEGLLIGADCGGVPSEEAHEVRTKEF